MTKPIKPITVNSSDYKREIREVFALNDSKYQLEITLRRDVMKMMNTKKLTATCAIYVRFGSVNKDDKAPSIFVSHWWCADDGKTDVHLVMTHTGCRVNIENIDFENLASSERDRLHAFFSELRGVRYSYVQDMFGFVKKDGTDRKQVFEIPFPLITAEPD